ncbi:MAG: NAD-dependent epimerase/dehydratase family protein [Pseudomonadota bacterium]
MKILVAGGGGFIGGHLVKYYLEQGAEVVVADVKAVDAWHQRHEAAENLCLDLRDLAACQRACVGVDRVFNLACDMGGMGFIEGNKALCMLSVLINTHLLKASVEAKVQRYFFASTACVYRADKQAEPGNPGLKETDVYPAMPEDGYGWEKLFSERMCRHFDEDFGLETRIARFHNVYGPQGTWDGGREKAPAAICRKVIHAKLSGEHEIEIWGDGEQTRSFMFIEDGVFGSDLIMNASEGGALNLGSDQLVSINQLVDAVEAVAGVRLERRYRLDAPLGVRGRSSDNSLIESRLGWSPAIDLEAGIEKTYRWIYQQMKAGY